MAAAAIISFAEMTSLMQQMPSYDRYRTRREAEQGEKEFRRAFGAMLKDCGDQLLTIAEGQRQIMTAEQEATIDILIDRIGEIFRRLDREGSVCLVGDCESTISELEEIDSRLILLLEEALELVRTLAADARSSAWFKKEAPLLARDLAAFSDATEERNFLLGLGWESEFINNSKGRG